MENRTDIPEIQKTSAGNRNELAPCLNVSRSEDSTTALDNLFYILVVAKIKLLANFLCLTQCKCNVQPN